MSAENSDEPTFVNTNNNTVNVHVNSFSKAGKALLIGIIVLSLIVSAYFIKKHFDAKNQGPEIHYSQPVQPD